jgi:hypothetical protein
MLMHSHDLLFHYTRFPGILTHHGYDSPTTYRGRQVQNTMNALGIMRQGLDRFSYARTRENEKLQARTSSSGTPYS